MAVRGCTVVAIEGPPASGKTSLVHALTARYRATGVLTDCVGEPARTSPLVEEAAVYGTSAFDLFTEVDLFGAQISSQIRASRHHELLFCDKTIANVLAYSRLVLAEQSNDDRTRKILEVMTTFCAAWASSYDAVYYCADTYDAGDDVFREPLWHLQSIQVTDLRNTCLEVDLPVVDVPAGLSLTERTSWVSEHLDGSLR